MDDNIYVSGSALDFCHHFRHDKIREVPKGDERLLCEPRKNGTN